MTTFEITLTDDTVQLVEEAEAYQLEGPMTTFFTTDSATGHLDSWSTRLASFRSADIFMIRRIQPALADLPRFRPQLDLVDAG